ncbi:MAG: ABC transporter permease, partial [Oscillospiraceae bacterium]
LLRGDMGTSIRTGQPVLSDLMQYYPATIELSIFAMVVAIVLGILFGVLSAVFRNKPVDQVLRGVSVSGVSIPSFWFSLLVLYVFFYKLGWFPGPGRLGSRIPIPTGGTGLYILDAIVSGNFALFKDALAHIILPALVLGFFTMGLITRQTRSNLLEVMSMDYI